MDTLQDVRYEDFTVRCFGNRFSYLGNGMSKLESVPDADLAHYIRTKDDAPIIGSKFTYAKAGPDFTERKMVTTKVAEESPTETAKAKL